jgi:hypothetical protein
MMALNQTLAEFNTDRSKIYLTGLSAGAYLDWDLAYANPAFFAAIVPLSGDIAPVGITGNVNSDYTTTVAQVAQKLKSLPIWIFHGALDGTVSVAGDRVIFQAFQNVGSPIKYSENPTAGHTPAFWDATYANPALWSWLFSQSTSGVVIPPAPAPIPPPVSTKFKIGDTIQATSNINVRATPSSTGNLVSTESSGATGVVVGGPTFANSFWWWQVRYANNQTGWSAEDFLVAYSVPPPVIPPPVVPPPPVTPPPLSTLPAHPRVWMTPARITQLQAQVAANTTPWQKIKASADALSGNSLPDLCLAYLGTGNAQYAQRAGVLLTAFVTNPANITALQSDDDYGYRSTLPSITAGLDWCYNGLTVAQRQQTATWLMNQADFVWPESNPTRRGAWGVADVENNYYWGFMETGPAALAAAGDDTGTGTISGTDRATYHMNLILSKWSNTALPFFASSIAGGAGLEGTGYDISGSIAKVADAFQTANQTMTTPWLAQSMLWHIEYTTPNYKYFVPFGDQARVSNAPMYIYNRINMLINMAAANAGATLNSQVQRWLTLIGQAPYTLNDGNLANELLYNNPSAPSVADLSSVPLSYLSPGVGDFIYRQSWTDPNATMMAFESGPLNQSHQSRDANGLMIWKGSFWVSASANIYSQSGIEQDTSLFNNLTVGGLGQDNTGGEHIVGTPQVSNSLVVVRGQAGSAYLTANNYTGRSTVSDYLRTVAYLPPQDTFVIVDQATARDPSQQKVWRWQSKNPAVISGNQFTIANPNGDARCVGQVLLPTNAVLGSQAIADYTTKLTSSYAVTVTLPAGNASDTVVTTLQCSSAQPVTASSDGTNVTANVGATQVTIPLNGTLPVTSR